MSTRSGMRPRSYARARVDEGSGVGAKAPAVRAVARSGLMTSLVTDVTCARALLAHDARVRRHRGWVRSTLAGQQIAAATTHRPHGVPASALIPRDGTLGEVFGDGFRCGEHFVDNHGGLQADLCP